MDKKKQLIFEDKTSGTLNAYAQGQSLVCPGIFPYESDFHWFEFLVHSNLQDYIDNLFK